MYYKSKIIKKGQVLWNVILYNLFIPLFCFVLSSIFNEKTSLNRFFLLDYLNENRYFVLLCLISVFLIYQYSKLSKIIFLICLVYPLVFFGQKLYFNFDKLVLIGLFFYAVFSFHFYYMLLEELMQSYVQSLRYKVKYLNQAIMPVKCEFMLDGIPYFGQLMNWSENSLFLETELEINLAKLKSNKNFKIIFHFNGEKFESECKIVSYNKDLMGFGFTIVNNQEVTNSWAELINILEERKIKPRLIYE